MNRKPDNTMKQTTEPSTIRLIGVTDPPLFTPIKTEVKKTAPNKKPPPDKKKTKPTKKKQQPLE